MGRRPALSASGSLITKVRFRHGGSGRWRWRRDRRGGALQSAATAKHIDKGGWRNLLPAPSGCPRGGCPRRVHDNGPEHLSRLDRDQLPQSVPHSEDPAKFLELVQGTLAGSLSNFVGLEMGEDGGSLSDSLGRAGQK